MKAPRPLVVRTISIRLEPNYTEVVRVCVAGMTKSVQHGSNPQAFTLPLHYPKIVLAKEVDIARLFAYQTESSQCEFQLVSWSKTCIITW